MESHLAAQDSGLVSQFVHKIGPTTDWAVARSDHKWYPSGNTFSSNGVRQLRYDLTSSSSHFADPLSFILQFELHNDQYDGTADKNIHLAASAHALFRRIKVVCGGTTVSDEDYVSRLARLMYELIPTAKKQNLEILSGDTGNIVTNKKTFAVPILAPLFMQDKYLPLNVMSCSISFELCDSPTDIMLKTSDLPSGVSGQSSAWHLEQAVILGSLVELDSSLSNSYSEFLLKGKSLTIPLISHYTTPHVITSGAGGYSIAMTRSLSRIKAIFQTWTNNAADKYVQNMRNPDLDADHPMEWQAQIGPMRYPSFGALKEQPEKYWTLQQAIGTHQSVFHTNAINLSHWLGDSHVIGIGLDKIVSDTDSDNFSSISTKMDDLLIFSAKNVNTSCDTVWTTIKYSSLLIINEEGCSLLE
jgi:hypothetical protein